MTVYTATAATPAVHELAEGILWDDRASLVRWVDIWKGRVLAGRLRGGRIETVSSLEFGQTTGAVALAEDNGLLVAAARCLATVTPDGAISFGPDLLGDRTEVRLNDGSVDLQGRFVVGTLSLAEDTGQEVLLRVSANGRVDVLREDIHLSNGIAFSPNGDTIYHVDTIAGTISRHSYGPGRFSDKEPWLTVIDDLTAYPDGLTVDATGALWIAQWGGSSVRRHSPAGELLDIVMVDAAQASCPAFIGPALDTLAITTAQEGLTELTDRAGTIFVANVGVTGLPAHRWSGSTTTPYWLNTREEKDA